ncbi:MAG TPA: DegT/DnrJ/EryC1/StrS family aminotransferase [Candidatus Aminicenantes bacterium]|nr:DegT/DnrJ/EryC1/StrS family aminotransferase [Candidatus Aminicenantes bacterium]HPL12862.1 DegT/DnrJ/EryC1/StrS family aminotransferase [Candidatus Aminicenantes bacterium]HQH45760.1 DegT/DnrJ/EryC1/StrS family aminotransferase [Candidatus Aminicenantes bacterium]
MNVSLLNLKAQYAGLKPEIEAKVLEVIASQQFVLGPEVEALEKEVAALSGTAHAVGVSSGTDAILVALMALEVGPGDAVLTTPFTFFATAGTIARLGARPVFADIDPVTFNLDPVRAREALSAFRKKEPGVRVKAVLPVHLYGQCADMDAFLALGRDEGLAVVEDAAQAIGADYPSGSGVRKAGACGHAGTLSFYPTKNLGGFGDGGMVLTNDPGLGRRLRKLRTHGETERYFYDEVGGNFRLDALQAAVLRVKLRHLPEWQKKRRALAAAYSRKFAETGLEVEGAVVPPSAVYEFSGATDYHTFHQYVIRAADRDGLREFLRENGVGTAVFYPLPLHLQKCFASLGYGPGDLPVAEKASKEVLALPVHAELRTDEQDYVVDKIREFYSR